MSTALPPTNVPVPSARLPRPLARFILLLILTQVCQQLLRQPAGYWLDPRQAQNIPMVPWLKWGPVFYLLLASVYILSMWLLITRLRRLPALVLAGGLFLLHLNFITRQARDGWKPFLTLTLPGPSDIFQVGLGVAGTLLLIWILARTLLEWGGGPRRWERWVGWLLTLGWPVFLVVCLILSFAPVFQSQTAQSGWRPLAPQHLPPGRVYAAVAYDPVRHQAVMFGGFTYDSSYNDIYLDDTWVWDGVDWKKMTPAGETPPPRAYSALGYDEKNQVMILYGGKNKNGELSDIWEWDGTRWRARCPSCNPEKRLAHSMVYDPVKEKLLVYGGFTKKNNKEKWYSEGWLWDGVGWEYANYANNSPTGNNFGAVYEKARQRTLFFFTGSNQSNTWTFANNTWTMLSVPQSPPFCLAPIFVYDPHSTQTLLFGGWNNTKGTLQHTWLFDGNNWRELALSFSPAPHYGSAAFYDEVRQSVILFGGSHDYAIDGDMWEFIFPTQ